MRSKVVQLLALLLRRKVIPEIEVLYLKSAMGRPPLFWICIVPATHAEHLDGDARLSMVERIMILRRVCIQVRLKGSKNSMT